jgi:coiled-coil domain-containing protein 12
MSGVGETRVVIVEKVGDWLRLWFDPPAGLSLPHFLEKLRLLSLLQAHYIKISRDTAPRVLTLHKRNIYPRSCGRLKLLATLRKAQSAKSIPLCYILHWTTKPPTTTMSSHETLSAASNDRKARLAQLKSLKRKQAPTNDDQDTVPEESSTALTRTETDEAAIDNSVKHTYLSGRNFDPETRNVKLGFDNTPVSDPTSTLEYKAEQLALETKAAQAAEDTDDKGLDLFKLQPKKANWDLKRDLEEKSKSLDVRTDNAIARMVRERIEGQKKDKFGSSVEGKGRGNEGDGQEVGMEGGELVEAMKVKELEDERERRREDEEDGS